MPKTCPKEFCAEVVRVAPSGGALLCQISAGFGIAESCLCRWVREAEGVEDPNAGVVLESAGLRALKRRNLVLEQENEILRRAAAFFAREISPK